MKNFLMFLAFSLFLSHSIVANEREIVLGQGNLGTGLELVYVDPPVVTYDDDLNELTVYFGSTSTIDLECVDALGTYYYIYGEYHSGNTSETYYYLPSGYYTVTIHSIYGVTYYGNFTVN